MKEAPRATAYDVRGATRLLPLLGSIAREVEERSLALAELELRIEECGEGTESRVRNWIAEAAIHRRELRRARDELKRYGCQVLGTTPLTIRIPLREGSDPRSLVWRSEGGD